jgi:hypothetical protein
VGRRSSKSIQRAWGRTTKAGTKKRSPARPKNGIRSARNSFLSSADFLTAPTSPLFVCRTYVPIQRRIFQTHLQKLVCAYATCPSCRMGNGFPKRSWPTQDWANEVWGRQHDRDSLRVYACPVQQGYWHLGHIRRSNSSVFRPDEISIKPINLEIFHSNQKES